MRVKGLYSHLAATAANSPRSRRSAAAAPEQQPGSLPSISTACLRRGGIQVEVRVGGLWCGVRGRESFFFFKCLFLELFKNLPRHSSIFCQYTHMTKYGPWSEFDASLRVCEFESI